ncbi:phage tail protein [Paenibacillus provencensis]|uniref:Phage tail protein n=1 Tax=Paenibacillus provencensis TaxID=441151 RepID=A0ABW3PV33_9BACL|nr:phage tail protein [Paenibacillus sp. MER 78]MCM3129023.1 phage tail protein [Paenibacillus sp. MER 78]
MALPEGIGVLGDIVFISTHYKIRTFTGFTRTIADRWATNDIIHKKPRSQFLGPGLDQYDMTVVVDARLGLNPRKEVDKLVEYSRKGRVMPLVIGGKGLGMDRVKIINYVQNWERIDDKGNLLRASYTLTLEEYVQ